MKTVKTIILTIIVAIAIASCQNNADRVERKEYIIDTINLAGEDLLVTNELDTLSDADFDVVPFTWEMLDTLKKCIISQENNRHFVFQQENGWYEYLEVLQNDSEIYVCRWNYADPWDDVNYVVEKIKNATTVNETLAIEEMYHNRTGNGKKFSTEAFFDLGILKNTLFK